VRQRRVEVGLDEERDGEGEGGGERGRVKGKGLEGRSAVVVMTLLIVY